MRLHACLAAISVRKGASIHPWLSTSADLRDLAHGETALRDDRAHPNTCSRMEVPVFRMSRTLLRITTFVAALLAIACDAAETFPARPLRIVVPFGAGSGADNNPRFYGELLRKLWEQTIVVDNRPGGS